MDDVWHRLPDAPRGRTLGPDANLLQRVTSAIHDVDCEPDCTEELTTEGRYGRMASAALAAVFPPPPVGGMIRHASSPEPPTEWRAQRRARQERTRTRLLKTIVIVWTLWTVVVIVANILDAVL